MKETSAVKITQTVAILVDGNNIERSLQSMAKDPNVMLDFDSIIPRLLNGRGLSRFIYFREGKSISAKLAERLQNHYMGSVVPCHKSADIPLSISATQIARKVDTIIVLSGDSDYVELVRHLKGEGVRVEIAAVRNNTADILIDEADHFFEIKAEDGFVLQVKRPAKKQKSTNRAPRKSKQKQKSPGRKKKKQNK